MAKLRNTTRSLFLAAAIAATAAAPASAIVSPVGKAAGEESNVIVNQSASDDGGWEDGGASALRSKYGSSRGLVIDCNSKGYCHWTVYKTSKKTLANVYHYGVASITKSNVYDKRGRKIGVTYKVSLNQLK
jgi:hypothetical protein